MNWPRVVLPRWVNNFKVHAYTVYGDGLGTVDMHDAADAIERRVPARFGDLVMVSWREMPIDVDDERWPEQ